MSDKSLIGDVAEGIVEVVIEDLRERKGLLDDVEPDVQEEIAEELREKIAEFLRS